MQELSTSTRIVGCFYQYHQINFLLQMMCILWSRNTYLQIFLITLYVRAQISLYYMRRECFNAI